MEASNSSPIALGGQLGQNIVRVVIDFTLASWNTVATHESFTINGLVQACAFYRVTGNAAAGAGGLISVGREGLTTAFAAAQLFSNLTTGNIIIPGATVAALLGTDAYQIHAGANTILEGLDLGYEITVAAFTGGTIEAICLWTPISSGATVVAGTGGAL